MKLSLVTLALLGSLACELVAARSQSNALAWRQFKQQHGKVYPSQEEDGRRFAIFMANKQLIESHNANVSRTFDMGLNHLADWTDEEYERLNDLQMTDRQLEVISDEELAEILARDLPVPDEIDWRKVKGRVSPVMDEKECGASWAFAATGLLEGQEIPQNMSSLVPLSSQELIDCSESNKGCEGGWLPDALYDLINSISGIESESDYPYSGKDGHCNMDKKKSVPVKIKAYKKLPIIDRLTLRQVLANYGPIAVAFQASRKFKTYAGGVMEDHACHFLNPNRAALLVGYGIDPDHGDYWIVKNSFGDKWGEGGYFRIKAGVDMCGIEDFGTVITY